MSARPRVLLRMRPTGRLHLGTFLGALDNGVRLQAEFECFYFVADWHAFTTDIPGKGEIAANTLEMAADWLDAELHPEWSTIFIQSLVPEHAELDCKEVLLEHMVPPLQALRERREHMAARPDHLPEVLREGSARDRRVASETLAEVKAGVRVA